MKKDNLELSFYGNLKPCKDCVNNKFCFLNPDAQGHCIFFEKEKKEEN